MAMSNAQVNVERTTGYQLIVSRYVSGEIVQAERFGKDDFADAFRSAMNAAEKHGKKFNITIVGTSHEGDVTMLYPFP